MFHPCPSVAKVTSGNPSKTKQTTHAHSKPMSTKPGQGQRRISQFISRVTARPLSISLPDFSCPMNLRFLLTIAVLAALHAFARAASTPASDITVATGFKVELLKSASEREGSWVSMAVDEKGRLYISPQGKAPDGGIMRLTLDAAGQIAKTDWLKPDIGAAMDWRCRLELAI